MAAPDALPPPQKPLSGFQAPPHFDRYSQRARQVLALAREEALRFNHNYIGTEHLLLGLVREGEGVAAKVLTNLDIELDRVRKAVEFMIGRGAQTPTAEIGPTPRTRTVLDMAASEAFRLGHHYIGTEHLLLGMIREGEGIAAGILESLGATLKQVRRETLRVLGEQGALNGRRQGEPGAAKDNVLTCRVADADLDAIDTLIEAGIRSTRSDAASWLIHAGIQAQAELFAKVNDTVAQIRRLRQEAQTLAQEHATDDPAPRPQDGAGTSPPAPPPNGEGS